MTVTPSSTEARGTVFRDHPDKAGIIFESSITNLQFSSNMNGIVEENHQPELGRYVLVIEPFTQIISIEAPGFVQERIRIGSPSPRDVLYYDVEPETDLSDLISVRFDVEPEDAYLYVDGQQTETNQTVQLSTGEYSVRAEREGFRIERDTIVVSSENIYFSYNLERVSPQQVTIHTDPPGANVRINDLDLGETDSDGVMALFYHPGDYQIDITADGYATQRTSIEIREDTSNEFHFDLERNAGTLNLDVQPEDATVLLNRREYDASNPIVIPPGLYRLEISKDGYETFAEDIRIERNQALNRTIQLEQKTGELLFSVSPSSAEVTLRDFRRNIIDQWTGIRQIENLGVGTYTVIVRANGYNTQRETFYIEEDVTKNVRIVLEESSIAESGNSRADRFRPSIEAENNRKWNFGIRVGMSRYQMSAGVDGDLQGITPANNFATAIFGNYSFNKIFSLQTEINFTQKSADIITLTYIGIPVLIKINVTLTKLFKPYIFGGPYAELLINKRIKKEEDMYPYFPIQHANGGIKFGLGATIDNFIISLRYDAGLSNISSPYSINDQDYKIYAKGLIISLGYSF